MEPVAAHLDSYPAAVALREEQSCAIEEKGVPVQKHRPINTRK
jgi:hypothetical protein